MSVDDLCRPGELSQGSAWKGSSRCSFLAFAFCSLSWCLASCDSIVFKSPLRIGRLWPGFIFSNPGGCWTAIGGQSHSTLGTQHKLFHIEVGIDGLEFPSPISNFPCQDLLTLLHALNYFPTSTVSGLPPGYVILYETLSITVHVSTHKVALCTIT